VQTLSARVSKAIASMTVALNRAPSEWEPGAPLVRELRAIIANLSAAASDYRRGAAAENAALIDAGNTLVGRATAQIASAADALASLKTDWGMSC
jgi:hypothetical protein